MIEEKGRLAANAVRRHSAYAVRVGRGLIAGQLNIAGIHSCEMCVIRAAAGNKSAMLAGLNGVRGRAGGADIPRARLSGERGQGSG